MFVSTLILLSGVAALSWEVVWQIKSSLTLGVSAWGTAITLAVTMGGMSVGALVIGRVLKEKAVRPFRTYAVLECIVGVSGLLIGTAFLGLESLDTYFYSLLPAAAPVIHALGIVALLGIPTFCLGATLPVFGLIARQHEMALSVLYGLNTLGAAAGTLLAAFVLIPMLGVSQASVVIAVLNIGIGILAWIKGGGEDAVAKVFDQRAPDARQRMASLSLPKEFAVVFVTGFATFVLEIAWFRSLTAAFLSTTAAFSIMLASVLIALGVGAQLATFFRSLKLSIGMILSCAGVLILVATPSVERFDLFAGANAVHPHWLYYRWFTLSLSVIGPPMMLLGVILPWILDDQISPKKWGALYGFNALSSVLGAVIAAWVLLPVFGFAKTAWMAGALVVCTGVFLLERQKRLIFVSCGVLALAGAVFFESGVGKTRVQLTTRTGSPPAKILQSYEGPDVTVSAVEHENGERTLVIDGFVATSQAGTEGEMFLVEYMAWMGHLPMLLHPDPQSAMVIAFGTGQTANAVRQEKPTNLDIVEINKRVLSLAPYFEANDNVLDDPVVKTTIMDGRAYLRRTEKKYDVITMESMPPTFAGVNALYSKEFYELARDRLNKGGIIAQWLPFHIVAPYFSASVTHTFQSVFPNSILWIAPKSKTGILVGRMGEGVDLGHTLPGYQRMDITRSFSEQEVRDAILLYPATMALYAGKGKEITDDNQLLAYGQATHLAHADHSIRTQQNFDLIAEAISEKSEQ